MMKFMMKAIYECLPLSATAVFIDIYGLNGNIFLTQRQEKRTANTRKLRWQMLLSNQMYMLHEARKKIRPNA